MSEFPELRSLRTEMDDVTAERQRERIRAAIDQAPRRRRWLAGLAVAIVVGLPTAAIAADGAVPGDLLYPVKRAVEPVISLVDPDVVVEHRIEEAEELARRGADRSEVDRAVRDARRAIEDASPGDVDVERLDRVTDVTPGDDPAPVPTTRPRDATTTTPTTGVTTTIVTDRTTTTVTTTPRDATTTTVPVDTTTTAPVDSTTTAPSDRPRDG